MPHNMGHKTVSDAPRIMWGVRCLWPNRHHRSDRPTASAVSKNPKPLQRPRHRQRKHASACGGLFVRSRPSHTHQHVGRSSKGSHFALTDRTANQRCARRWPIDQRDRQDHEDELAHRQQACGIDSRLPRIFGARSESPLTTWAAKLKKLGNCCQEPLDFTG